MRLLALLLLLLPLIAAGVVIAAVMAIPAVRRKLPRATRLPPSSRPDSAVRIVIGVGAVALILSGPPILNLGYQSLGYSSTDFWWWRYAVGLFLACLTLLIIALLLSRYHHRPQQPVAPSHRRTWRSFTTASQMWILSISAAALLLLVAFAGSVSSPDDDGRYRMLEIDTGGGVGSAIEGFFGWAYGLPTAAAAAVLVALTITALALNATRPFLKPATAQDEEASRATLSGLLVWFAVAAVLLTLGWAMRTVATAAGLSLSTEGYVWDTPLAALSPWLFGLALFILFLAYLILGLVIAVAFLRPVGGTPASSPTPARVGTPHTTNTGSR